MKSDTEGRTRKSRPSRREERCRLRRATPHITAIDTPEKPVQHHRTPGTAAGMRAAHARSACTATGLEGFVEVAVGYQW